MTIILIILSIIGGLIALFFLIALFVKKEYALFSSIPINKPKQEVFDYIRFLKNQDHFSKWVMTDPNMKKDFKGTDGAPGFVYAWDSENKQAGKGEQEIMNIIDGERMDVEIRFIRPFEGISKAPFTTKALSADQTEVTWGMIGKSKYPMNIMNLFIMGILEKDLKESLNNLKVILEKEAGR